MPAQKRHSKTSRGGFTYNRSASNRVPTRREENIVASLRGSKLISNRLAREQSEIEVYHCCETCCVARVVHRTDFLGHLLFASEGFAIFQTPR